MTKSELLQDLASKDWCDSINGDPQLQEVKSDGGKWYIVNIREVQNNVAVYRNISFYVVDEGLETEKAYYKDSVPSSITEKDTTFSDKVRDYMNESGNSDMELEKINEEQEFAVIRQYIEESGGITERRYFLKEVDGVLEAKEII